jgi:hypothetical protein
MVGGSLLYSLRYLVPADSKQSPRQRPSASAMSGCQSPCFCFKVDHWEMQDLRRRTEIIPVKAPHTRIKALALASGHGRYITVTPERTLFSVGEWPLHVIAGILL